MKRNTAFVALVWAVWTVAFVSAGNYLKMFDAQHAPQDPCYDDMGQRPTKCVPDFINAAFGRTVTASSTCGDPVTRFCYDRQEKGDLKRQCHVCDSKDPARSHPPSYLTDLNNPNNLTCWHSAPMLPGDNQNVTLTLSLGKKYELTYVNLQFCGDKPDSLSIHKSMDYGATWQPFQYYSSECLSVFDRPRRLMIGKANEQEPLCTDAHLQRQGPLGTSSRIAFSTLEGRPSAHVLDASPVLQDWVTATDIRVMLHRPRSATISENDNSALGDPYRRAPFTYSVADLSVGGRCKCNGHASRCVPGKNGELACQCAHNTAGRECEKCKPFHFDRPWGRATDRDAHPCV
ncbi:netrin-1, partial [Hyalella azteca]